jgi:hypothetical protein
VAYTLAGLIGKDGPMAMLEARLGAKGSRPIQQRYQLLELTEELRKQLDSTSEMGDPPDAWPFRRLSVAGGETIRAATVDLGVAYVEAEFFGGVGDQASIVWEDAATALGPVRLAEKGFDVVDRTMWPINQALRRLGVIRGRTADEFRAVGL